MSTAPLTPKTSTLSRPILPAKSPAIRAAALPRSRSQFVRLRTQSLRKALAVENRNFFDAYGKADSQQRIKTFLANGGQTPTGEMSDMSSSYSKFFKE
jgi:hypothetical protein